MRNKKRLYIFYLFAFEISVCLTISLVLLSRAPNPSKPSKLNMSSSKYFINFFQAENNKTNQISVNKNNNVYKNKANDEDTEITRIIRSFIHNSYLSYQSKCQSSDYLQPISGGCLNSSGLSLTAIESLEILYLSGLFEDFVNSTDYVLDEFTCSSSSFQNFHEMGTKVLGSLIGIYSLTKNYQFIDKAVDCANVMKHAFTSSIPHPLLDGIKHKAKKYSFIEGNLLSESSGFILEFSALSKITGDSAYEDYVQNYLNCVLSIIKSSNSLPAIISVDECCLPKKSGIFSIFGESHKNKNENSTIYSELNEYTISFIANVIRLHLYSPSNTTTEIIDLVSDFIDKNGQILSQHLFDSSFCQLNHLMKKIPKLKSTRFYKDMNLICDTITQNSFPIQKSDVSRLPNLKIKNDGFYFDFIPLIDSNSSDRYSNQLKYLNLLNTTQCNSAQCALISQDPIVYDDLMPAELLSKWLKFLYLGNSSIFDFSKENWIINEAGHLIPSNIVI